MNATAQAACGLSLSRASGAPRIAWGTEIMTSSPKALASLTAFALAAFSDAASAQTSVPIGTVEATIDGTPYRGQTLHVPSEGTATAEFRLFGNMALLSMQAHDAESQSIMRNVLSIEAGPFSGDAASAVDAAVNYFPDGVRNFYVSDDEPAHASVTFEALSLDGEEGSARGAFSAFLCKREGMFAEIDPDDCITVEGTFDTTLHRAD